MIGNLASWPSLINKFNYVTISEDSFLKKGAKEGIAIYLLYTFAKLHAYSLSW